MKFRVFASPEIAHDDQNGQRRRVPREHVVQGPHVRDVDARPALHLEILPLRNSATSWSYPLRLLGESETFWGLPMRNSLL